MSSNKVNFLYRPHKTGFKKFLGDLEADVMEIIWGKGSVTVRDVYHCMLDQRDIAYTTVMSTTDNQH